MARIESTSVDELKPHQTSTNIYQQGRPDERFIQAIKKNGVEKPIVINEQKFILDGVRRWKAVKAIDGMTTIECRIQPYQDEEKAILRLNDDRNETFAQKMRVAMRYKKKVENALDKRMKMGKSIHEMGPEEDPAQEFAEGENVEARKIAGDRVGWSDETLRKAEPIWHLAQKGVEWAVEKVEEINEEDESIHSAHQEFQEWRRAQESRARINWSEYMEISTHDQMFDLYESAVDANLADVDQDEPWTSQVRTLREYIESIADNMDQVEASEYVFAWHLEKRGYIELNGEDGPESIVDREPTKEELEELYWNDCLSIGELAIYFGVSTELIKAWMREKDVSLRFDSIQDPGVKDRVGYRSNINIEEEELELEVILAEDIKQERDTESGDWSFTDNVQDAEATK